MFNKFGNVKKVVKYKNMNKFSFFIKMGNTEESLNTIAQYQAFKIKGRRILLQFTKSKV